MVDASVAAKWVFPGTWEPLADHAGALFVDFENNLVELIVPDVFWVEIANYLWKAVRREKIQYEDAEIAWQELNNIGLKTVSSHGLLLMALNIAVDFDRAVYDCIYISLARTKQCQFITADEKLVNAVASRLPVRWLGTL